MAMLVRKSDASDPARVRLARMRVGNSGWIERDCQARKHASSATPPSSEPQVAGLDHDEFHAFEKP